MESLSINKLGVVYIDTEVLVVLIVPAAVGVHSRVVDVDSNVSGGSEILVDIESKPTLTIWRIENLTD